jgi:hypothetical protein
VIHGVVIKEETSTARKTNLSRKHAGQLCTGKSLPLSAPGALIVLAMRGQIPNSNVHGIDSSTPADLSRLQLAERGATIWATDGLGLIAGITL